MGRYHHHNYFVWSKEAAIARYCQASATGSPFLACILLLFKDKECEEK